MTRPTHLRVAWPCAALCLAALAATGCASQLQSSDSIFGLITPYRIDIVQGNVVTKEQLERIKPGVSRAQVRDALGSPLLTDIFHANRWDYVFTLRRPGTEPQRRSLVLLFDGDVLKSIDAPALPGETEFVAAIGTHNPQAVVPALELTDAQRRALPAPVKAAAAAAEPASAARRNYPPLEP